MQGNLNEIDIRSILQLISLGQRTGQLLVEACFHNSDKLTNYETGRHYQAVNGEKQFWFVFFLNGQIIFCQQGDTNLSRINDYLHHYRVEKRLDEQEIASLGSHNAPEYGYIWALLERNIIPPKVAHSIIHSLVNETLFDLLSLHQGSFIFRQGVTLTPHLTNLEIAPLVYKITQQIQAWKQLYPHIESAEQLPIVADMVQLQAALSATTINKLKHWADGKKTLRQLARRLNRDILTVAKALYPYVQQGCLQLVYLSTNNSEGQKQDPEVEQQYKPRVVCIDDTKTVCETVESILKAEGYEAIALTNPLEALSLIFQIQPDLILCDIAMPQLNGYEICAMLRHSSAFENIPIIMLTGKDKFIDRLRATMVGATDYLTKPFGDTELLMLVEKYINVPSYLGIATICNTD
jgi:twitching motility two-component system response regulator PilG